MSKLRRAAKMPGEIHFRCSIGAGFIHDGKEWLEWTTGWTPEWM
jgi:hypothetical protein